MQYGNMGQEGLNSSVPLTHTIYENYEILSKKYIFFRGMSRDSPLPLYAGKHAKLKFHYGSIVILNKYMLYFITKIIHGIYLN